MPDALLDLQIDEDSFFGKQELQGKLPKYVHLLKFKVHTKQHTQYVPHPVRFSVSNVRHNKLEAGSMQIRS